MDIESIALGFAVGYISAEMFLSLVSFLLASLVSFLKEKDINNGL